MERSREIDFDGIRAGFTLIELLAVVAVIGVLAGIILGVSGTVQRKAAETETKAEIQHWANALEEYRLKFGRYPQTPSNRWVDIEVIVKNENEDQQGGFLTNQLAGNLDDPVTNLYLDSWATAYKYRSKSSSVYHLWSFGPDRNSINNSWRPDRRGGEAKDNIYAGEY